MVEIFCTEYFNGAFRLYVPVLWQTAAIWLCCIFRMEKLSYATSVSWFIKEINVSKVLINRRMENWILLKRLEKTTYY